MSEVNVCYIKPSVERLTQKDLLKHIEAGGRTCYKSEEKITSDSAEKFVKMLCSRGHTAATEHGTLYFTFRQGIASSPDTEIIYSPHSHREYDDNYVYITTNFRVVFEECEKDFNKTMAYIKKNAVEKTDMHENRVSFRIICDRGVTHELVRHRVFSFAQESTRYVRYGDKQEFKFILPSWWEELQVDGQYTIGHTIFTEACQKSAEFYSALLKLGHTPQQARAVLPNAVKTEIVMTGTIEQWVEFLKLRLPLSAHPDMRVVAKQIYYALSKDIPARYQEELGLACLEK